MTIEIIQDTDFSALQLIEFLARMSPEVMQILKEDCPYELMRGIPIDDALFDVDDGLRVQIEGRWYQIETTWKPL